MNVERTQAALGRVEVEQKEVSTLLARLQAEEFGASELVTLDDIAEVTGASVDALARMLAEIRDVPEIAIKLADHEVRLASHERRLDEHDREFKKFLRRRNFHGSENDKEKLFKEYREWAHQQDNQSDSTHLIFGIILLVLFVWYLITLSNAGSQLHRLSQPQPYPGSRSNP